MQLVRGLDPGRESDELPELGVGEPTEPDPDDALGAGDVDERVGEARRDLAGGVSIRRDDQHARGRAGPHEVAQEEQRRRVRPVDVLEHEQDRRAPSGGGEHVGDRRVQAVALRVGIHSLALGGVAGLERERRQQAPELGAVAAERLGELVRPELPTSCSSTSVKGSYGALTTPSQSP